MSILTALNNRARFVNPDGTLTPEASRLFEILRERVGSTLGDMGADVFAPFLLEQTAAPDIIQPLPVENPADMLMQPAPLDPSAPEMVQQQAPYSSGTALQLVNYSFSLKDTAVVPGTYGDSTHVAQITVDQQGRITAAANVAIAFPGGANYSGSFTDKTVVVTNGIITSVT